MVWNENTDLITNNAKNKNAYYCREAMFFKKVSKGERLRYKFYGYVNPCTTFWV